VLGYLLDSSGEQSYLHFGRAGVAFREPVFADDFRLGFLG
jgi:hypothetical protein